MSSYTIQSLQTHRFLYTDGHEKTGDKVQMVPNLKNDLDKIILTASRPLEGDVLVCSVLGKAGLFVSVGLEAAGEYLIWRENEFLWEMKTAGGNHEFCVPAKDLYWFTDKEIESNLIIQTRLHATENDILFRVVTE